MKEIMIRHAQLVTPNGVLSGDILIEDGCIVALGDLSPQSVETFDAQGALVMPGFVDIHIHGYSGFDFTFGQYLSQTGTFTLDANNYKAGFASFLEACVASGVTTVLPTTMAAPMDQILRVCGYLNVMLSQSASWRSFVAGVNIEGSFLVDPAFAGAQNADYFYKPTDHAIDALYQASGGRIGIINLPPEHGESILPIIEKLSSRGILVAGGHTGAFGDETQRAIDHGMSLSVHFFNGPSRSSYKGLQGGGAFEAMLCDDRVSLELIADGYHIDPAYVRDVIERAGHERIIGITDSMFVNELPNVRAFELLGLRASLSNNGRYLEREGIPDTLFGSVLSCSQAFGNLLSWLTTTMPGRWYRRHVALSLDEALCRVSGYLSANPARLLRLDQPDDGRPGVGQLARGFAADLLLARLDRQGSTYELTVERVMKRGSWCRS